MIGRLHGQLLGKNAPWVLIDIQGIGYELQVPMSTLFNLPELHTPCTLLTHLVIREDAHSLYGFLTLAEKDLFKTLIKVSGIGPRIALAVLSSITPNEFHQAVHQQDTTRLVKIPGIGKKTAERLLLELKGQLGPTTQAAQGQIMPQEASRNSHNEIIQALAALGYTEKEAQAACKGQPEDINVTDGLKQALRHLSKG